MNKNGMLTATFIFKPGNLSPEFHEMDKRIEEVVRASEGYLGRKKWTDEEGNLAVVYYWASMQHLETFRSNAVHGMAKSRYGEWYEGYRVEVCEVIDVYGDGYFDRDFPPMQ